MTDIKGIHSPYGASVTIRWDAVRRSTPTWLTITRFFSPVYLTFLYQGGHIVTFTVVAIAAAATDWFDGYLARKWKCESDRGAELDIYADKILCMVLTGVVISSPLNGSCAIPIFFLLLYHGVVIYRRVFSSLLFKSSRIAKLKMFVEMPSLIATTGSIGLFVAEMNWIGAFGLWVTACLSAWSMSHYLYPEKVPDWPGWLWRKT